MCINCADHDGSNMLCMHKGWDFANTELRKIYTANNLYSYIPKPSLQQMNRPKQDITESSS